jgi:hypothetical protein
MRKFITKLGLGAALAATALTTAAPADAQRYGYRGYRGYHRGDSTGAALLGGIVGLGVGAAIASNANRRYYDRGYYDRGYYGPGPGYSRGYYDDYYRPRCWTEYRGYYGRPVRVCE